MMMRAVAISLVGFGFMSGPVLAGDEPAKPSSCAFVRSIDYWKPIDATHAYIYTSPKRKFIVTFFAPCRELKWAIFARIETRPSSSTCLSAGDTIVFARGGALPHRRFEFEERCMITAIEAVPIADKETMPEKPAETPPAQ